MKRFVSAMSRTFEILRGPGVDRRTKTALMMALVATLGAVCAYSAASNELRASKCEHKLDEEQNLGLMIRQRYLDQRTQFNSWREQYTLHFGQGDHRLQQAEALRKTGPSPSGGEPGLLEVGAQVEFALARQLWPLVDFTYVDVRNSSEEGLGRFVASGLDELGFGGRCVEDQSHAPATASTKTDYAKALQQDIQRDETRAVRLAFAVVLFVAVLASLTLAEALGHPMKIEAAEGDILYADSHTGAVKLLSSGDVTVPRTARISLNGMPAGFDAIAAGRFGRFYVIEGTNQAVAIDLTDTTPGSAELPVIRIVEGKIVDADLNARTAKLATGQILTVKKDAYVACNGRRTGLGALATRRYGRFWVVEGTSDAVLVDLTHRYGEWLERLGYVLLFLGLAMSLWTDRGLWAYFALTGLVFLVMRRVGLMLVRRFRLAEGSSADDQEPPETRDLHLEHAGWHVPLAHPRSPFGSIVLVSIAVVALLSAASTFGYSKAISTTRQAAREAIERQVAMFKGSTAASSDAYSDVSRLALLYERRTRHRIAQQLSELASRGDLPQATEASWRLEADRWDKVPDDVFRTEDEKKEARKKFTGSMGPDRDPYFPQRVVFETTILGPAKDFALWDGQDEVIFTWVRKATGYLATLTVFAIVLYLLGQALGMGRTTGGLMLAMFGGTLALVGAFLLVQASRESLPPQGQVSVPRACQDPSGLGPTEDTRAAVAALCYARGEMFRWLAHTNEDYAQARDAYQGAIDARPNFAIARLRLGRMRVLADTPQVLGAYINIMASENLPKVIWDIKRTIDFLSQRGLKVSARTLGNYAFYNYLMAPHDGDIRKLEQAISDTDRAIHLDVDANLPYLRSNLGLYYLAEGQMNKARDILAASIRDISQRSDSDLAAGDITALGVIREACPRLAQRGWYTDRDYCSTLDAYADELKSALVQAGWHSPMKGDVGAPQSLTIGVSPAGVGWDALHGFADPKSGDTLVAVWYQRDPEWGWYVLPKLSYQVDPARVVDGRNGDKEEFRSYLAGSDYHDCLEPGGRYKVEFYLNGKPVRHAEMANTQAGTVHFKGVRFLDVGVAMCIPAGDGLREPGWEQWQSSKADPELVGGYITPDKTRGALVFGYIAPRTSGNAAANLELQSIARAVEFLQREGLIYGTRKASLPFHCEGYWDTWENPHVQYVFDGTPPLATLAKAWTRRDGMVHVGVVWRPVAPNKAPSDADLSCSVLTSMSSITD